jgi:hypothetical protein|tara:strand:+ start:3994 stop:4212 length:219 start_codon:yes stop_codon:yes gene_type:complete
MYKSRTFKKNKDCHCHCGCKTSPLKNVKKVFSTKKNIIIREKDVFVKGCNDKLFECSLEEKKVRKMINNRIK